MNELVSVFNDIKIKIEKLKFLLNKPYDQLNPTERWRVDNFNSELEKLEREQDAFFDLAMSTPFPQPKVFSYENLKNVGVQLSCCKYLDAIARRIANFYLFYHCAIAPIMVDVLAAKDGAVGDTWDYKRALAEKEVYDWDRNLTMVQRGDPLRNTPLPELFTFDEVDEHGQVIKEGGWTKISKLVSKSKPIFPPEMPFENPRGQYVIVIPHSEYSPETIAFLKEIGIKTRVITRPNDLEVMDETFFSENIPNFNSN